MSRGEAWLDRPIYNSLPAVYEAYHGNEVVDDITKYWDEKLIKLKADIDDLPRQLNPLTCDKEYLPLLSYITGFTGSYTILDYPEDVQRKMISRAYDFIWKYKGSEEVLGYILTLLEVPHRIWYGAFLVLGYTRLPHPFSTKSLNAYVLISIGVRRNGVEWNNVRRNVDLYTAAFSEIKIAYDAFYLGYSALGEPLFSEPTVSVEAGHHPGV